MPIQRRRIKALIIKEMLQIVKDPSSILISVVLPILLIFLYSYGVSLDLDHLRVGMVLEETSPDAISLYNSFTNSRYFDVKVARDRRELIRDLEKGAIRGMVVIPSYFSQFRNRKEIIAPVQAIADGSEPNTAQFFQNYVQGAFQTWLKEEHFTEGLTGLSKTSIQSRYWYNEQLESRYFLLPGSLAITMTLIGILLTALVIAREWERGTMESMMSTPVSIGELIIGKMIPYFCLAIGSMLLGFFLTVFILQIPFRGSFLLLLLVSSCFLFAALSLGLMISTLSKNQLIAFQLAIVTGFLPAYILSGFLFEISSMPLWIRILTRFMPPRYFVTCLQTLFLVGNVGKLLLFNILPMLAIGMICILITLRKTVKRLD